MTANMTQQTASERLLLIIINSTTITTNTTTMVGIISRTQRHHPAHRLLHHERHHHGNHHNNGQSSSSAAAQHMHYADDGIGRFEPGDNKGAAAANCFPSAYQKTVRCGGAHRVDVASLLLSAAFFAFHSIPDLLPLSLSLVLSPSLGEFRSSSSLPRPFVPIAPHPFFCCWPIKHRRWPRMYIFEINAEWMRKNADDIRASEK